MKKIYSVIVLLSISYLSFADFEKVCVLTNTGSTGEACNPKALGAVTPCATLNFKITSNPPALSELINTNGTQMACWLRHRTLNQIPF